MKRDTLKTIISSLEALGVSPLPSVEVEVPRTGSFGDLSTPIAMGLSKQMRKSPKLIAEDIIASIKDRGIFEKIEVAGPGFINFSFSGEYLYSSLRGLIQGDRSYLREDVGHGKKVLVEFVSANPTGPLHIGHAKGAAVGNALCNLLSEANFAVEREYYVNDFGRQVQLLGESVFVRCMQMLSRDGYHIPEDGYQGDYIDGVATDFIEKFKSLLETACHENWEDDVKAEAREFAYAMMLDLIKEDLKTFGVAFDTWISERGLYEKGEVDSAIAYLKEKGFMYEKDEALWFRSTDFTDDKDRVVRKKDSNYTYFASDIAYHKDKLDRGYDLIIDIWGADHHGYITRIESVMKAFGYDSSRFKVILVQMVNLLKHGQPYKMSKRAGTFVTLREIVDLVGADTTKFIFLTRKADSHLDFDVDVVTAQSAENPVFYVQYANARINSIIENARSKGINPDNAADADLSRLIEEEELTLIKKLLGYPMMLEGAAIACEPHRITFYLQELAGLFHPYYHKFKVLSDDNALSQARLALCVAIKIVLKDALTILGVTAPDKM